MLKWIFLFDKCFLNSSFLKVGEVKTFFFDKIWLKIIFKIFWEVTRIFIDWIFLVRVEWGYTPNFTFTGSSIFGWGLWLLWLLFRGDNKVDPAHSFSFGLYWAGVWQQVGLALEKNVIGLEFDKNKAPFYFWLNSES